ncbi:HD domain-containing protein [Actinoplanes sp. NPDC049265]|uniref:HD domain-containing protein n=1 Tax=Actinoplanes sp. NPDC049265 TaxID=3363902 RepID=UPI0037153A70
MSATHGPTRLVHKARDVAQILLAGLPERWRHTIGVARRAEHAGATVDPAESEVLEAAAWLHDIGYAPELRDSGFHPLDGARHLAATGWSDRIAGLVGHHSAAFCVAEVRGLAAELARFPHEVSPVSDALTYADQTVGPNGRFMNFDQRLADMLERHGPHSPNAAAHTKRSPLLRAAVERVERRLTAAHSRPAA